MATESFLTRRRNWANRHIQLQSDFSNITNEFVVEVRHGLSCCVFETGRTLSEAVAKAHASFRDGMWERILVRGTKWGGVPPLPLLEDPKSCNNCHHFVGGCCGWGFPDIEKALQDELSLSSPGRVLYRYVGFEGRYVCRHYSEIFEEES